MPTVVVVIASLVVAAALLAGLPWLAARARRRGLGGSPLTPLDEIWHPAAHGSHLEIRAQAQRADERVTPGDPPWRAGSRTRGN